MPNVNRLENGDSRSFWAGVSERRLLLQKCRQCARVQFPPRCLCAACWSDDLTDIESSGRGTIESLTIVRRAPLPAWQDSTPYVVAAITVAEGPRLITNIIGDDAFEAAAGDEVAVDFAENPEGVMLPQFRRVRSA